MNQNETTPTRPHADPHFSGVVYALLAGIGYTASNVFLRSVIAQDPFWVSSVKALPTVLLVGPWLVGMAWRGQRVWPPPRVLGAIVAAGLLGQLAGNVCFQFALGVVGIGLTVQLTLGSMIVFGGLLGRLFLHESISPRMAAAMLTLIVAIFILSSGADDVHRSVVSDGAELPANLGLIVLGVAAACFCGLSYTVLGVVIRHNVTGQATVPTTMFLIGVVGALTLGPISLLRVGWSGLAATDEHAWALMLLAGVCNTGAFLALTKSLQLIGVSYVNTINGCQGALAALCGVLIFHESMTTGLVVGTVLTTVGLVVMRRPRSPAAQLAADASSHATLPPGEAALGDSLDRASSEPSPAK